MSKNYLIPQTPPVGASLLEAPTQAEICQEPIFRRATWPFVREQGGNIVKQWLRSVEALGLITDRSRFMCQRSPFVAGAFPSPPNWHLDYMPGTPNEFARHVDTPTRGAMTCVCCAERIATTTFLTDGRLELTPPNQDAISIRGGEYLEVTSGHVNWCTPIIAQLILAGRLQSLSIEANRVYLYDSRNFHRAPRFAQSGGFRLVLKVNTPPDDFPFDIPKRDELLKVPDFYFVLDGNTWRKETL